MITHCNNFSYLANEGNTILLGWIPWLYSQEKGLFLRHTAMFSCLHQLSFYHCLRLLAIVLYSQFHITGIQYINVIVCTAVPLYNLHAPCTHVTMLIPQKHHQNYTASFSGVPREITMLHQEVPFKVSTIVIVRFRPRLCFLPFRARFKTPEVASLQAGRNQNWINTQRAFHQSRQGPMVQDTCNRVSSLVGAKKNHLNFHRTEGVPAPARMQLRRWSNQARQIVFVERRIKC